MRQQLCGISVEFVPLATATTTFSHRQVSVSWSIRRRGASLLLPSPMPMVPRQPWMSCSDLSLLTMEILSLQRFQIALVRQPVAGDPNELGKLGGFESVLEKSGCDRHAGFQLVPKRSLFGVRPTTHRRKYAQFFAGPEKKRNNHICVQSEYWSIAARVTAPMIDLIKDSQVRPSSIDIAQTPTMEARPLVCC